MSRFHADEFTLDLPEALQDRSVNIFSVRPNGPNDFSLVIVRDWMDQGANLDDVLERYRSEMAAKLPQFRRLSECDVLVDGCAGKQSDHIWKTDDGIVHQRQTIVSLGEKSNVDGRGRILVFTATCPKGITPQWEETLARIMISLKLNPKDSV